MNEDRMVAIENKVKVELGNFIKKKIEQQEIVLKQKGMLEAKEKLSQSQLARMVGISPVWMNNICRGEKMPNNEILKAIANNLLIDEYEIFKVARRLPPQLIEDMKREFLGEYYIPNLEM